MSGNQGDWHSSPEAIRREDFFTARATATTSSAGRSGPSGPSRNTMPEEQVRRGTPHPVAGTSGVVSTQRDDDFDVSHCKISYEHTETIRKHGKQTMDRSRQESDSGSESHTRLQSSRGTGRKITFTGWDDVDYHKGHSPESSPESAPDVSQVERCRDRISRREGSQLNETLVSRPRAPQTQSQPVSGKVSDKGKRPVRYDDTRYDEEGKSQEAKRRTEERRRGIEEASEERRTRMEREARKRRADSEERRRQEESDERWEEEQRRRSKRSSGSSGQGRHDRRRHDRRRRERSKSPGTISKFLSYVGIDKSK